MIELSFASTLLDQHKAAIDEQVPYALSTNEKYLPNDDEDNLTLSNKENCNILNSNSSKKIIL